MDFKLSLISLYSSFFLFSACHQKAQIHTQDLKGISNTSHTKYFSELDLNEWKLPNLTQDEKEDLIYSVKTVFNDFYVHRTQKKSEYGYDSQAEANKLSVHMSSEELLRNVSKIYANVRDYHTIFFYPFPARCYIGGFPLNLKVAYQTQEDGTVKEKLLVAEKLSQTLKTRFATDGDQSAFSEIREGDEIIAITNLGLEGGPKGRLTVQEALAALQKWTQGANSDAAKTRAVQIFFSRNGAFMKPPTGRFELTIKRADNKVQTYSFPWVGKKSTLSICEDLNEDEEDRKSNKTHNTDHTKGFNLESSQTFDAKLTQTDFEEGYYQESFKHAYGGDWNENIEKRIVSFEGKKFGIIRINAFVPSGVSLLEANYLNSRKKIIKEVQGLRKFIIENRDLIEGLIFDVRNNGGGYGVFPQLIANAFTSEFVANMSVQPLVSKMNRDTFHNLEFSRYFKRLNTEDPLVDKNNKILTAPFSETADEMDYYFTLPDYTTKELMLNPAPRFDEDENDELPPEYTAQFKKLDSELGTPGKYVLKEIFTNKPIAIFTNSNCYSSCDIFSALMKDYNIAKMFGETGHTGGGGANVVEWNSFAIPVVLDEHGTEGAVVPNAKTLPKNIRMRFAWNRIVREKAADQINERYIEGSGVLIPKENVLKPTTKDVLKDGEEALEAIMKDMLKNPSTYPLSR